MSTPFEDWNPSSQSPYSGFGYIIEVDTPSSPVGTNIGGSNYVISCRNHVLCLMIRKKNNRNVFGWSTRNCPQQTVDFVQQWEKALGVNVFEYRIEKIGVIAKFSETWIETPLRVSFLSYLIKLGGLILSKEEMNKESIFDINYRQNINSSLYFSPKIQSKIEHLKEEGLAFLDKFNPCSWETVIPSYESRGFIETDMRLSPH